MVVHPDLAASAPLTGHQTSPPIGQPEVAVEGAVDPVDVQLVAVAPAAADWVVDGLE